MKTIHDYFHHEYVFQFLMGLNDTFSHIWGQFLLINPLPPINRVFALVLQEEPQREVSASIGCFTHTSAPLMSKYVTSSSPSRSGKLQFLHKDKPTCSCGIIRQTIEKCYKFHSFPLGFKFTKNKGGSPHSANQVQDFKPHFSSILALSITPEQCQQLLTLIKPASSESFAHQVSTTVH
jgi:hypothetical protein